MAGYTGGDWDRGHGRRPRPRSSAPVAARAVGGVVALAVALGILFLAFRSPSGHPAADTATTGPTGIPVGSPGIANGSGVQATSSARPSASSRPSGTTSAAASGGAHGNPLGTGVQSYLAGRSGTVRVAVFDLGSGKEWTIGDAGSAQDEASIVKVDILETLMSQKTLTSYDQSLAQQMIEDSSNDAATTLWNLAGGATGIGTYNTTAGLTGTTPSSCVTCPNFPWPGWGLTKTTPEDQITLLRRIVEPGGPLTAAQRQYALSLMENVSSGQAWGVSGGVPSGVTIALKNGWLPLDSASQDWQINSIGWVNGDGRNYLLAMLSTGNPTEQYGIDTLNQVATMVWQGL